MTTTLAASPSPATDPSVGRTTSSARRRGLSYLRALSHNRTTGGTSPNEPTRSPRHYFQRSLSYNDNRPDPATTRRRSASRPDQPSAPLVAPEVLTEVRSQSPAPLESRSAEASVPQDENSVNQADQNSGEEMARHRTSTARRQANVEPATTVQTASEPIARPANPRSTSKSASGAQDAEDKSKPPAIRFFPHQEIRNGRPSLNFTPISRTLPSEHTIIRVGRYSEREGVPATNPTGPSDAPVGFKSKVVSRKHCEFSFLDGQWQIKDVASSSGTFLNHIRLSQPNTESRLYPVKDGDIVQLGIDFRGGEEMIFRCVKIRIECNRAWQKKPNNFKYDSSAVRSVTS
jgi:E3 ubiquitin-protein ligase DMA1/2